MRFRSLYITTLLYLFGLQSSFAQKNATLVSNDLIELITRKFGLTASFDKDLVSGVPMELDTTAPTVENWIKQLNINSAFIFEKVNAKNLIIKPKKSGHNFLIQGKLSDRDSKEALFSAVCYSKKQAISVNCDEGGNFVLWCKYEQNDSIAFHQIGYTIPSIPLDYFTSAKSIYASNNNLSVGEVNIVAYLTSGINYDVNDNSIVLQSRNTSILPGQANPDVLQAIDALPGISSIDSKAGNLNVRGSTPDQMLLTFDNIPLYQKGHLFGTIAAFNSYAVDKVKVQRSDMNVNQGGRVGGVIDIQTSNQIANKIRTTVAVSRMDASFTSAIPIIKDKLSLVISGRQSFPYSWQPITTPTLYNFIFQYSEVSGALQNHPEVIKKLNINYNDYNSKLIYRLNNKHTLTLGGLYNGDALFVDWDKTPYYMAKTDNLNTANYGASAVLNSAWDSTFSTRLLFTISDYENTFKSDRIALGSNKPTSLLFSNKVENYHGLFETNWKINRTFLLQSGYEYNYHGSKYLKQNVDIYNTSLKQDYNLNGSIHTVFINMQTKPFRNFFVNAGTRFNYFDVTQNFSFEPRINLGYKISESFRLKSGASYQKQFISQVGGVSIEGIGGLENQLWLLANNTDIPVVNSYQAIFGGIFQKKSWLIDVEAYYKDVNNISNISIKNPLSAHPYIYGKINTIGTDILIRKEWKMIDVWTSYSLSKSMMHFDSISPKDFYSLYDQTHIIDVAGSAKFKGFKVSLGWKYRTGLAALPGIRTKMLHGAASAPSIPGGPPPPLYPSNNIGGETEYKNRYPDIQSLDGSVQYSFPRKTSNYKITIGVSVQNIYNQTNIYEQSPIKESAGTFRKSRIMMGSTMNAFLSVSF